MRRSDVAERWGCSAPFSGADAGQSAKESSEMTRARKLGLCIAAVLAVSVAAASSASAALPEFVGPFPAPFTAKSGATVLETVKKAKITCLSDTGSGEVTGPKTGSVTIVLKGCELET